MRSPLKVLCVDAKVISETMAKILTLNGFQASFAVTAGAAVELARVDTPDVAIIDWMMAAAMSDTYANGVQAAVRLRAVAPGCRFIFLASVSTMLLSIEELGRTLLGGEYVALTKPVRPQIILDLLHEWRGGRAMQIRDTGRAAVCPVPPANL